jgi:PAT family beta-lactamase induction signal transducer AmpG
MWGSKIIGVSASLSLGSWLLNQYNFTVSIAMLSVIVGFIMLVPIFIRERPGEKMMPWSTGVASLENKKLQLTNWKTIFKSLYSVFSLRNSLLLATMAFLTTGAYNYMDVILPIFTVKELGWTDLNYSQLFASATLIGGISGLLIGGILIDKFGKKRMLNIYFMLLVVFTIGLVLLKSYWANTSFIYGFMILYSIMNVFATIGIFAIAMQCCWKKVSASQFTLYMTISNIGRIALASLIGPIKAKSNWEITILAFAGFIFIAWILLQFLNMENHVKRVEHLELNELENEVIKLSVNRN